MQYTPIKNTSFFEIVPQFLRYRPEILHICSNRRYRTLWYIAAIQTDRLKLSSCMENLFYLRRYNTRYLAGIIDEDNASISEQTVQFGTLEHIAAIQTDRQNPDKNLYKGSLFLNK